MASVKTAISLPKFLLEQVEALAGEMNVSRSRLFALAMEDFIRRRESQKLLEQINEAYAEGADPEEQEYLRKMHRLQRKLLKDE